MDGQSNEGYMENCVPIRRNPEAGATKLIRK